MSDLPKTRFKLEVSISGDRQRDRAMQTVCIALTLALTVLAARIASVW